MGTFFDLWSLLALLALLALFMGGLWIIIPQAQGLPRTPTRRKWIRKALQLAAVQPGETVYDLGAGDGRTLVLAAREFGARTVGFEIEPVHCAAAWLRALFGGVIKRVSIHRQDMFEADLGGADVVFFYLTPAFVERLRPKLERELRPGTRVVSISFNVEGWEPEDIDIGHLIFMYRMPPQPGGINSFLHRGLR
jgi:SAM-dependent methyltransferase